MRGAQEAELQSLCGGSTSNESVEPATPVASGPASQSTPASAPKQPRSKSKKDHTSKWVETTDHIQSTSAVGLLGELSELILMVFEAIKSAVSEHRDLTPVREVLVVRQRFKLWKDAKEKLDQDLGWAPDVRKPVVEILTILALDLGQGIQYYEPQRQGVLRQMISRNVDHAKILVVEFEPPNQSEVYATHDIFGFLSAKHRSFKSRVDKLFELLPIVDQSFGNIDGTEPEQKPRVGQHESLNEICPSSNVALHTSQSSATNRNADCREHLSNSARSSIRPSSSDTQSSRSPSPRSGDDDLGSRHAPVDTITSPSTSHVARSSTWPTSSNASMSPQDRPNLEAVKSVLLGSKEAIPNAHAQTQALSHHPVVDGSIPNYVIVDSIQSVKIWNSHGEKLPYCRAMLDNGSHGNFIIRSLVEKCEYNLHSPSEFGPSFFTVNKHRVQVSDWVLPDWQFRASRKKIRRKEVRFWVIDTLPSELDMLIGEEYLQEMGIYLRAPQGVLVAHRDWGKDVSGQSKSQRAKQAQESAASQDRRRKTLMEEHAAAGEMTQHSKSSQKENANKNHGQHRKS